MIKQNIVSHAEERKLTEESMGVLEWVEVYVSWMNNLLDRRRIARTAIKMDWQINSIGLFIILGYFLNFQLNRI